MTNNFNFSTSQNTTQFHSLTVLKDSNHSTSNHRTFQAIFSYDHNNLTRSINFKLLWCVTQGLQPTWNNFHDTFKLTCYIDNCCYLVTSNPRENAIWFADWLSPTPRQLEGIKEIESICLGWNSRFWAKFWNLSPTSKKLTSEHQQLHRESSMAEEKFERTFSSVENSTPKHLDEASRTTKFWGLTNF